MEGPGADSEAKREPVSDMDTDQVDGLKVLDPNRPIREADILERTQQTCDLLNIETECLRLMCRSSRAKGLSVTTKGDISCGSCWALLLWPFS